MFDFLTHFHEEFGSDCGAAVIGDSVRKALASKKGILLSDLKCNDHLDIILLPLDGNIKRIGSLCSRIFQHFQANPTTSLCYDGQFCGRRVEFVGVRCDARLYTPNLEPVEARPDLTIERFGWTSPGGVYDESGFGYADFDAGILRIINDNLGIQKYFKILSIMFQTGFKCEKKTETVMEEFIDQFRFRPTSISTTKPDYNMDIFVESRHYAESDEYRIGIHVALLYLRCIDSNTVTSFIEKRSKLRALLDEARVDYRRFHEQRIRAASL